MGIKLFELGFVLKIAGVAAATEQLGRFSNALKATEAQSKSLKDLGKSS
jgi:hypothetical protein